MNVWEKYEGYKEIVNKELVRLVGHCSYLSQDVQSMRPHDMIQSIILIDILNELKMLNEKLDKPSEEVKTTKTKK